MYLKRLDFQKFPDMFENAMHRSDANDLIEDHAYEIFLHVAKVWLFPRFEAKNHWVREIAKFIKQAPIIKTNNKPMKSGAIASVLRRVASKRCMESVLEDAVREEDELIPTHDIYDNTEFEEFTRKLNEFINKYAEILSRANLRSGRIVLSKDIYEILRDKEVGIL